MSKTPPRRDVLRIVVLAMISAAGIVGMLLVDGIADWAFFALSMAPLVLGGWRAYSQRHIGIKQPRVR